AKSAAPAPVSPRAAADARPGQPLVGAERQRGEETELRRWQAELEARTGTRRAAKESAGTDAEQATGNEHSVPRWVLIGIGVFAVALLVMGVMASGRSRNLAPGATRVRGTDRAEMVYVPAGEFTMGSADSDTWAYSDEKPQQRVTVAGFWIDRTEVTNAQYRKFVDAGGYGTQEYWTEAGWAWKQFYSVTQPNCWNDSSFNQAQQPVVCVSWYEAYAYARWVGGRLPSEAEWEKAARGTDGRIYPWGNTWDGSRLNHCDQQCQYGWKDASVNDGYRTTAPVGSYANGTSPYGAMDLAGNVEEWVSSEYGNYPYGSDDGREDQSSTDFRVLRGGSWNFVARIVRSASRYGLTPGNRGDNIGFRVASPGL
ncbi:MAG: formylglycine-generating enzyme family protein, partial [Anaerolineae bacterium]